MSIMEICLRIITFLAHFSTAIFLLVITFKCSSMFISNAYMETVTDSVGYALIMNVSCQDPSTKKCFYGMPQAYDVSQYDLKWNVFALLAAFEWLSASFALYYLKDLMTFIQCDWITITCIVWNVIGIFIFMPYSFSLSLIQTGITTLALISATISQLSQMNDNNDIDSCNTCNELYVCNKNEHKTTKSNGYIWNMTLSPDNPIQNINIKSYFRIILHYTEYCTSASLLFIAVLILFVVSPVTWAPIVGFTGILLCNLTGIGAHYCALDQHKNDITSIIDLDWTKCGNHFKLFIIHSWSGLLMAVFVIIYLARDSLFNSDVPVWVRFILGNLLVTYTLFGIWATVCYSAAGTRSDHKRFNIWMERLDYGLTVLSPAAKLPIAFTVYYGLIKQPGANVC